MKTDKLPSGVTLVRAGASLAQAGLVPTRTQQSVTNRNAALRMETGIIRLFGKGDIANRGLVSGWAVPEEGHTWNDGLEAVQTIEMAQLPNHTLTITAEGVPYVFGDARKQEIPFTPTATASASGASPIGAWHP